jgi:hypothetical protein
MSESPKSDSRTVLSTIVSAVRQLSVSRDEVHERDRSSKGIAIFLSVVASILIWFMISMRESYSVVRDFPTTVVNVPQDRALRAPPPEAVRVQLEGRGWQLLKLITSPQAIRLDASTPTVDLFRATSESLPSDVRAQSVNPPEVRLRMEERLFRRLPIDVQATVKTVAPFDLVRPVRALPDSVAVSGAATIVESLASWKTKPLERDNVKESFTAYVELDDTLNGLVDVDRAGVLLQVEVAEFTEHKRLLDVKVTDAPPSASRFQLMPNRVSVRYTIPLSQFEVSAVSDSFYATVPYDLILADTTGRVVPSIRIPEDLAVKDLIVETPRLQYYVILE